MQAGALEESDVFEWWDNGVISQDEAEDILNLLEEGNTQEACALAEVYAQEACQDEFPGPAPEAKPARQTAKNSKKNKRASKNEAAQGASLAPHGYILWKARIDSTGHRASDRKELQVTFYYYTLRLGSQNLLSYKAQGYEAHFGNISTRELHSQIPTDTLMGTVAYFPLGHFLLGSMLDTAKATNAHAEFLAGRNNIAFTYWHTGSSSFVAQASTPEANIAAWYQLHQSFPLVKLQIHSRETARQARERERNYTISWNTTAYMHGAQVPDYSRTSSTILKNKLWASQNIAVSGTGEFRTKAGATASLFAPIDTDTLRARFKFSAETGPNAIHAKISTTCLDAAAHCMQNDLTAKITSQHGTESTFALDAGAKTRYSRENGRNEFGPPRIEAGIAYAEKPQNRIRMAVILPKGAPQEAITLRNESKISSNWLQCALVVDFKQTKTSKMHPARAYVQAKAFF